MARPEYSSFAELKVDDVEDTGEELGVGAYGKVTKVFVKGFP